MVPSSLTPVQRQNLAALILLLVGLVQLAGYVLRAQMLRAVGAATAVAPLPNAFADVDGFEAFASDLTLVYRDSSREPRELHLTAEGLARLAGPDERRRMYGAAFFQAPRLPESLWLSVYCHGMDRGGPVRRSLGLSDDDHRFALTIRTRTRGRHDEWTFEPACSR
jgi:hypothetical protein